MNTTIRQRENGKWQAIVSYKNKKGKWKQKSKGGFDKRKDASLWANEMSYELKKLEKSGILDNEYTLEEVFELYIEVTFTSEKNSSTKAPYLQTLIFFNDFKDYKISEIKPNVLLDFIKEKRAENGNAYNIYISKLSTIFNFAIKKLRACSYNPCELLYKATPKEDERIKFINENLYKKIVDNFKKEKQKLLIRVLYETGMRSSEAFGIITQNVIDNTIKIDRQYIDVFKIYTKKLKTKNSYRTVPISPELFKDLKKATVDMDGRIFYDIQAPAIRAQLRKFNVSPHCFRHTRATILVSSGIDLTVVSYVMGDKIETILKTYVNVNNNDMLKKYELIRKTI